MLIVSHFGNSLLSDHQTMRLVVTMRWSARMGRNA
jgi:hypothetical protein